MTGAVFFPRLATRSASELLANYSKYEPAQISKFADTESEAQYWYQTAPQSAHVDRTTLEVFRATVVEIAESYGFPDGLSTKDAARTAFDRDVVAVISGLLPLQPVEAAEEEVWNFLSLVVAPDVTLWRWPNSGDRDDYERVIGKPRNVFRRLWWRAFLLDAEGQVCAPMLYEDEAVAILERTNIGFNPELARTIARIHIERFGNSQRRTETLRDAMKRIRRLYAFIVFSALTTEELEALVSEAFDQTEDAMYVPASLPPPAPGESGRSLPPPRRAATPSE